MHDIHKHPQRRGFSLVELLITLAILGVLSAMAIPPLFQTPSSNQTNKWNAIAKDASLMVMSAYEQYRAANTTVASTVSMTNLTPYMNYASIDTSSTIDSTPNTSSTGPSVQCSASTPCLVLHNGAKIHLDNPQFIGTTTTNVIQAQIDPDGIYTSSTSTQGDPKSLQIEMYYDGYVKSRGTARNPSCHSSACNWTPDSKYDPSWFTGF